MCNKTITSELYIVHKVQIKISSLRWSEKKVQIKVHAWTWTWAVILSISSLCKMHISDLMWAKRSKLKFKFRHELWSELFSQIIAMNWALIWTFWTIYNSVLHQTYTSQEPHRCSKLEAFEGVKANIFGALWDCGEISISRPKKFHHIFRPEMIWTLKIYIPKNLMGALLLIPGLK